MGRLDWAFVAAFSLVVLVPWGIWMTGLDPRMSSALIGSVALFGLVYRFVSLLPEMNVATRVALLLLAVTLLLGAIGQYDLAGKHAPLSNVAYPLLGHRVACVLLAIYWRRWLHTTRTPLLKARP